MATVTKDFRVKNGLVVEGSTATVNGSNVLTEASTEFIQDTAAGLLDTTHSGISFSYNDATGKVSATVSSTPTFSTEILFEGATADSFETTLNVTDPTADRTITLPDASGTVALTSQLTTQYTDELAQDAVGNAVGTGLTYNDGTGAISVDTTTIQARVADVSDTEIGYLNGVTSAIQTQLDAKFATANASTTNISEGTNLYFTDERAQDAVGNSVGTGLSYNDTTGAVSVDTSTIQARVADVSDTEIGYLNGVTSAIQTQINSKAPTADPTFTGTVTGVTKAHVGLGNVDNTSDANKPVSTATQSALDLKAPLASPALTGTPTAPTATAGTNTTQVATTAYVETAVSNLVDGAPALLNTLNELAAAINDDASFSATLTTSIGEKVAKSGDTMTGALAMGTNKITGLGTPTDIADAATKGYVDGLATNYEASGAVSTHASDTSTHGVGEIVGRTESQTLTNKTISGADNTLSNIANSSLTNSAITINGTSVSLGGTRTLGTDDISEGSTNKYFSTELAQDAVGNAVGTGLTYNDSTGAISNSGVLSVTGTANQVVADASTGAVTLSLPQSIHTAATPTFGGVTVGSVTLTDALMGTATQALTDTSATIVDSWSATTYSGAKYLVQMKKGNDIEILEILVAVDGNNNVYLTEYADVISNEQLGTTDADYSGGNIRLKVTASNGTTVKVHKTLIEA